MSYDRAQDDADFAQLVGNDEFIARHVGPDDAEIRSMLNTVGTTSLDALIDVVVPDAIRMRVDPAMDTAKPEHEIQARAREIAAMNQPMVSMIGMGYYDCHTPAVIRRNVLENPGWYTAYTPYQAEVSQGRLEALLNYQQMVIDLTGMPLANASLLDEATAAAEALSLVARVNKAKKSSSFFVDENCHPQTIAVLQTRATAAGMALTIGDPEKDFAGREHLGVLLQYPDTHGALRSPSKIIEDAHAENALVVVATDLLALALIESPGKLGADVVVGSSQRFGVPMGYGGPHAAFFATHEKYQRNIPGRIIGVSVDRHGNRALRMALQTREQHIRREKATSNICTAQVLLAIMASMFAVYHGGDGVRRIASRTNLLTRVFAAGLGATSHQSVHANFFDTLLVNTNASADAIAQSAVAAGINLRKVDAEHLGIAFDETTTREQVESLWRVFGATVDDSTFDHYLAEVSPSIPTELQRSDDYLSHPTFNQHRTETEMLRYLRKLQSHDIALDRSMIALGSCTMKLNATTEMEPISDPGFARLHPFAPIEQSVGYQTLFSELAQDLCEITGYDRVSLQPNAGSQGEFAGLLAIRAYHQSRGDVQRDVCLIPSSAHGTNPASAIMAGMRVVVVDCDAEGNVSVDDLRAKIDAHRDALSALMITYPSTHGVFENAVIEICELVHDAGGQVYLDGANLNAMVGICRPGDIGSDVSHLNLHKTFCIPHGGGGPGVGPIGVKAHLAPFLPSHSVLDSGAANAVAAAPWGSASILPISWAYIKLMGRDGLRHASKVAILNANYIAKRLNEHYPIVYTGVDGRVAHECIIDMSGFKESANVSVEDVAKRLIDYGYHAPTMSWPVADSMMVEPTESESKAELDRFCDALISIREEIRAIETGAADKDDNVLRNAPHTAEELVSEDWPHAYARTAACFPSGEARHDKFWPSVARVDNVQGDRNLVCTCPSIDAYRDEVA